MEGIIFLDVLPTQIEVLEQLTMLENTPLAQTLLVITEVTRLDHHLLITEATRLGLHLLAIEVTAQALLQEVEVIRLVDLLVAVALEVTEEDKRFTKFSIYEKYYIIYP